MTDDFRINTIHQMRLVIERFTAKHRRENPECPTPLEYLECWASALAGANQAILNPRRPADRPKKIIASCNYGNCPTAARRSEHEELRPAGPLWR
jgi:hypothetical protein